MNEAKNNNAALWESCVSSCPNRGRRPLSPCIRVGVRKAVRHARRDIAQAVSGKGWQGGHRGWAGGLAAGRLRGWEGAAAGRSRTGATSKGQGRKITSRRT